MMKSLENDFEFIPDFDKLDELDNLPVMENKKEAKEREYIHTIEIEGKIEEPNSRCCVVQFETYQEKTYVNLTELTYDELGGLSKMKTVDIPLDKWNEITSFVNSERKFQEIKK